MSEKLKILVASHRLPFVVQRKEDGLHFIPSVGGLATGLVAVTKAHDVLWVGTPGIPLDTVSEKEKSRITSHLLTDHRCLPLFLETDEISAYYNGYSNNTIWPLFHYFPVYTNFDKKTWECYKNVNQKFADLVGEHIADHDILWIHDYHLMLLPALVRQRYPAVKIGFFLHIPFPSFELFRILPERREIIEGLLGADLIGFHTFSYLRHFLTTVLRVAGHENTFGTIHLPSREIKAEVFPLGIDYRRYSNTASAGIKREIKKIKTVARERKIILSIDRLDYTKGIQNRLAAWSLFLEKYPYYHEKVMLILIAVPSRMAVGRYRELKEKVDKSIGAINGQYSTLRWTPIWYLNKAVSFETLMALYVTADIALLTPIRDGMNLIAKEFVAAKRDGNGVIIISEMAGVAEELGEAIIVNPYDTDGIADQIKNALEQSDGEKKANLQAMQERLKKYDIEKWTNDFINRLDEFQSTRKAETKCIEWRTMLDTLRGQYRKAKARMLIFDYDGTLVPFMRRPEYVIPDKALLAAIKRLASNSRNAVVIISGRTREYLEKWFGDFSITLIAEHGVWLRRPGEQWEMPFVLDNSWKKSILPVLSLYTERTPRTFVEEKEYSLVWHFRNADPEFASLRLNEIKTELLHRIANMNLGILEGNKVIEIKSLDINKGKIIARHLAGRQSDFLLCMGDDVTDEDMFTSLPLHAYTIKIGQSISSARFFMESSSDSQKLITMLSEEKDE